MPVTEKEVSQLKQTGVIFAIGNALLAPVYYADNKWGVTASIAATLGLGYFLHAQGKQQRESNKSAFFSSPSDSGMEEAFNNILAGGEKVCEQFTGTSLKKQ
ncbi:hypothetical protein [Legionella sp. km772]|uniref:hypothetical protein n=1 Tax=Legionella sp. km772 TaxID=2498111 RepID=UPI000F8DAC6E|nr:hypothetical protein [Legionella sp. km772]RUR10545.1 hypothetical protein ELY15_08070 [Legionella sp. km772]